MGASSNKALFKFCAPTALRKVGDIALSGLGFFPAFELVNNKVALSEQAPLCLVRSRV